jgi:transcriptional regulator with XRE-family HTH domain
MVESKCVIGVIIQYWREKLGITQQELADRMDADRQYIWKVENGKINMSLNYLDRIIICLGCTHKDFFSSIEIS